MFSLRQLWKSCAFGWISASPAPLSGHCCALHALSARPLPTPALPPQRQVGGFVRLSDGRQLFFRRTFSCQDLHELFPWFDDSASAQSFIATWELLAQCALVTLLDSLLGVGHLPVHCVFKCDNSAADSASWKGLSMALGLCHILRSFLVCQQAHRISVHIDHVPGITNDVADALSRGSDPLSFTRVSGYLGLFSSHSGNFIFSFRGRFQWFSCPVGDRSA